MKHKRRFPIIDAYEVGYDFCEVNPSDLPGWLFGALADGMMILKKSLFRRPRIYLETPAGRIHVRPTDCIIRDSNGWLYICNSYVFDRTYEPVEKEADHD